MGELTITDTTKRAIHSMSSWMDNNLDKIIAEAPEGYDVSRVRGMAIQIIRQAEKDDNHLNECTPISLVGGILKAVRHGLDLDTGEAYLIAYRNSKLAGAYEAELQFGWRGLAKMVRRGGADVIQTALVREGDYYEHARGTGGIWLEHRAVKFGDADIIGVYAMVRQNGVWDWEEMSVAVVEDIRSRAPAKNSPAWRNYWGQMARKVVLRRLLNRCELSDEDRRLVVSLDAIDVTPDAVARPTTADLNHRFAPNPGLKNLSSFAPPPPVEVDDAPPPAPSPPADAPAAGGVMIIDGDTGEVVDSLEPYEPGTDGPPVGSLSGSGAHAKTIKALLEHGIETIDNVQLLCSGDMEFKAVKAYLAGKKGVGPDGADKVAAWVRDKRQAAYDELLGIVLSVVKTDEAARIGVATLQTTGDVVLTYRGLVALVDQLKNIDAKPGRGGEMSPLAEVLASYGVER